MLDDVAEGLFRILFRGLFELLIEVFVEVAFRTVFTGLGRCVARAVTHGRWPSRPATEKELTICGVLGLLLALVSAVASFSAW